jgi:pyruvate,water dikinase
MTTSVYVRWFKDIRNTDVLSVGGKNASLGELYSTLSGQGIRVPNGFALTAACYRDALTKSGAWDRLHTLFDGLDKTDVAELSRRAAEARTIIYDATGTDEVCSQVTAAYQVLELEGGRNLAVAVRSSATAEDLPTASFAGQHESFLNVRAATALFEACRRCFATIATDRAISYRIDNGFDHFKVFLSVGVMRMIRSDQVASGVIFTLDTESGFRDVVFVTGAYGLGGNVVQGQVNPDEFYVHKTTFRAGHRDVLRRSLGDKSIRMIYRRDRRTPCSMCRHARLIARATASLTPRCCAWPDMQLQSRTTIPPGPGGEFYIVQARPGHISTSSSDGPSGTGARFAIASGTSTYSAWHPSIVLPNFQPPNALKPCFVSAPSCEAQPQWQAAL